jgi:Ni/Co efflux regulator RcnB
VKKKILTLLLLVLFARTPTALSADNHDHGAEGKPHSEEGHEDSHDHSDGDHAEAESSQTGPEKGILAASADNGIKLSPEAEKHFEIRKMKVTTGTMEIPRSAVVTAGLEVNVFRFRDGYYKRIDFVQLKKSVRTITLQSRDLKVGDEVALTGLGFLRTAEIAAFGGAPEGHSH